MKRISLLIYLIFIANLLQAQDFQQLLDKGDEFFNAGNYPEAVKYFTQAIKTNPKEVKGYWYRGDAYKKDKKFVEAIKDYSQAIELDPKNWRFYKLRGDCYYNSEQYTISEKDYSYALTLDDTQSILWLYRGDCYKKLKQTEKACADYQKAHELGEKEAKNYAKDLPCEWLKNIQDKPCPNTEFQIGKVEIEPFTGAVSISKGLTFKELELKPKEGIGFVTSNTIGLDETFILKLTEPRGFCEDTEGMAFFGAGFVLYEANSKEIGKIDDLYASANEGLPANYLKSLTMTLGFSKPLEVGKMYLLKVRFFDKRGKGEAFVNFPIQIGAKTQINNSVQSTKSTLGIGINSASVETSIKSFDFQLLTKKEKADIYALASNQNYQANLYEVKNLNAGATYIFRWVNEKGEIVSEQSGKTISEAGKIKLNFDTKNIVAGNYQIWLKVQDNAGKNIGITIPTRIK